MRIVVDEWVPDEVAVILGDLGHEVILIAGTMPGATDADVLAFALAEDALLLTEDKGFGEMVVLHRHSSPGVLLTRLDGSSRDALPVLLALAR